MWYIPKSVVLCAKLFNMHFAPLILWKEIEYQIYSSQAYKGFMLPLPCSLCYEWYHIVFLCWICIESMPSEPLWKMYLHGNKHFLNLNLKFDVIKWKHFPRYWPFVWGIYRLPVNSPHKGQWHGALIFSLICAWINGWVNKREAGDLRRHRARYDGIVMTRRRLSCGPLWLGAFTDRVISLAAISNA